MLMPTCLGTHPQHLVLVKPHSRGVLRKIPVSSHVAFEWLKDGRKTKNEGKYRPLYTI